MADIDVLKGKLNDIGEAIRSKTSQVELLSLDEMPDAIRSISGGAKPEQSKTVTPTASGLTVTPDEGYTLSSVSVNGDANLIPENVKAGVQIFDILGTFAGGGGIPSLIDKIDAGSFLVPTKTNAAQVVNHNLGAIPDMWICWADLYSQAEYERFIESTTSIANGIVGGIYIRNLYFRASSTATRPNFTTSFVAAYANGVTSSVVSSSYVVEPTATQLTIWKSSASYNFKPGFVYKWVAVKFK